MTNLCTRIAFMETNFGNLKSKCKSLLRGSSPNDWPIEANAIDKFNFELVKSYTGISKHRAFALMQAIRYIIENKIPGDFIEFGVAKGGSAMLMALTLKSLGVEDRDIYLYDLFGERPHYSEWDVEIQSGKSVGDYYDLVDQGDKQAQRNWEFYSAEEVIGNLRTTGYIESRMHLIKGDVCDTLTRSSHQQVALMRLDTDFYHSTKHELQTLYPKLVDRGVVVIDDYGHWQGARKATEEFLNGLPIRPLLFYIDSTARQFIKC
jgi:O-methyltransferase